VQGGMAGRIVTGPYERNAEGSLMAAVVLTLATRPQPARGQAIFTLLGTYGHELWSAPDAASIRHLPDVHSLYGRLHRTWHTTYLKSSSPEKELASFLCTRAECLIDNGRLGEAIEAYGWACNLAPNDLRYRSQYDKCRRDRQPVPGCDCTNSKFGQLVGEQGEYKMGFVDYVPPEKENCKALNVNAADCETLHNCFSMTLTAIDKCCLNYSPVPFLGILGYNSNSAAFWLLQNCLNRAGLIPDAPLLPPGAKSAPGWRVPRPKCITDP
jgi:hypothetical protein